MRRSLAALGCGLALALAVGCGGGGGDGKPQSGTPDKSDPTVSIPGPGGPSQPSGPAFLPGEVLPPIMDDTPRLAQCRKQIETLNQAVHQYISKHKAAPVSLAVMAQPVDGSTPYFDPSLLLDPWGAAVHYDARGPRNQNKQPDIWSVGSTDGTIIANWSDQPVPAGMPPSLPPPSGVAPEPLFPPAALPGATKN